MAKNIMIQGTMSNAGKSLLCAGLCRIFKQDGYRVAPFKSQNMALNSFITESGGEMGRAQVVQAEAAGIAPDVRMNPILLKPTTDVGSQVIVNGQVQGNMNAMEYYQRKREFVPAVLEGPLGRLILGEEEHAGGVPIQPVDDEDPAPGIGLAHIISGHAVGGAQPLPLAGVRNVRDLGGYPFTDEQGNSGKTASKSPLP